MSTPISTTEYRFAHGKAPRGRGYWCFNIKHRLNGFVVVQQFWHSGFYAQAKRNALSVAKGLDTVSIAVGS